MSRFVSLPVKVIALTVSIMLFITALLTAVSLQQMENEFDRNQIQKQAMFFSQYEQLSRLTAEKLEVWVETMNIEFTSVNSEQNVQERFLNQIDSITFQIDNSWIFDKNGMLFFKTTPHTPAYIPRIAQVVLANEASQNQISCSDECQHIVALPVRMANGDVAVAVVANQMTDILYSLKASFDVEIAVMTKNASILPNVAEISDLDLKLATNKGVVEQVLQSLPVNELLRNVELNNYTVNVDEKHYWLNLIAIKSGAELDTVLVLIDDVTAFREGYLNYKRDLIISAFVIFFLLSITLYFVTKSSSRRLLNLSSYIPLLAEKKFDEFRRFEVEQEGVFKDELDILTKSVVDLSVELEELQVINEHSTKELKRFAMFDLITGLPNRNMLNTELKLSLSRMADHNSRVAILFLDLDDFKKVNDSHGHQTGDRLLQEAANRLRLPIRENDIACRFGGDEFVVIMPFVGDSKEIEQVAEKIIAAFKSPIYLDDIAFYISTSIGAAVADSADVTADDMIRNADMAMYEAKNNGGNAYFVYDAHLHQRAASKVMIENEVTRAIEEDQFTLHLQPQIEIATGRLFGFEALIRWIHPSRGMIPPNDFIPVLESSNHMIEVGYWVIKHSFKLLTQLIEYGYPHVTMAINISAAQFLDPKLPHFLNSCLREFNLKASSIELELTERTVVEDVERTLEAMNLLKKAGFKFSIDDFGTGYSSLSYLKEMPVDCIKIDQCFVGGMLENLADMQIVLSTISMVQNMGQKVTAEGVETQEQLDTLSDYKCDLAQGYFISRPIPEEQLFKVLRTHFDDGVWDGWEDRQLK